MGSDSLDRLCLGKIKQHSTPLRLLALFGWWRKIGTNLD